METKKIQELLNQIDRKEILLPEFQRGYVWNGDQVRDFMHSLYRDHPTGHILIWNTYKPMPARGAAAERNGRSLMLLDGQQRLTTLYVLFRGKAPDFYEGKKFFPNLYFNMETEKFRFHQKPLMAKDPAWINVHEFLSETLDGLLDRMKRLKTNHQAIIQTNLKKLSRLNQIREYEYTIDQVSDDKFDLEEVVEIFDRINRAGTQLKNTDLALAHICSIWPKVRNEMRVFQEEMEGQNFGVEFRLIVRCLVAVATGSVRFEGKFLETPASTLQTAWEKMQAAFRHLVGVLRRDAFIDSLADLKTHNVLVPVTVYLARQSDKSFPNDEIKSSFIRWIYLAVIWGRYSGSSETRLQQDVALVAGGDTDPTKELEAAILRERGRIKVKADDLKVPAYSAFGRFSYVLARASGTCDWFTGKRLYDRTGAKRNGLIRHCIFPKNVLEQAGFKSADASKQINELANHAVLTRKADRTTAAAPPNKYLPKLRREQRDALNAQSIPLNSRLWRPERYPEFLAERRKLLAKAMNEYIASLGPKDEKEADEADVRSLVPADENDRTEFKSSLRWDIRENRLNQDLEKMVIKTLAGFLNAEGGTLFIGVNDDGKAIGLAGDYDSFSKKKNRDGFELHLWSIINRDLGADLSRCLAVQFHKIDGREICRVSIDPSPRPVFVKPKKQDHEVFYLRTGNATNPLQGSKLVEYIERHWGQTS